MSQVPDSPASAPPPLPEAEVWREGKKIVMYKGGEMPPRCVKTNAPMDRTINKTLYWHHPALTLMLFAGLIPYVIVALVMRKSASVRIPVSNEAMGKRRVHLAIAWAIALGGLAMFGVAIAESNSSNGEMVGVMVIGGIVGILASAIYGIVMTPILTPARIDDHVVMLKGACPEYLDTLRDRPW